MGDWPAQLAEPAALASLPSFGIALPVYNEAAVIERCIEGIAKFLDGIPTRTGIIAVDDGSKDNSHELMLRLQKRLPRLIVHKHEANRGYGGATRTLCRVAVENGFDYAIVMDSDRTQNPRYIANFFPLMLRGREFINANPYQLGGGVPGVSLR